jgi:putative CocE/NonD family hydrolase
LVAVSLVSGGTRAIAASAPVTTWGYIGTDDGVQLRYTLVRPAGDGRFPVAVNYGPYTNGSDPLGWSVQSRRLLASGYAVLGVNIRGTGCSTGDFDLGPRQASDAYEVIEWSARQPWSTGHTGMYGLSAPGILQYGPAGLRAPHLDAIAPFQTIIDAYRDVAFPGGMLNIGFASLYAFLLQPVFSDEGSTLAVAQGDAACAATIAAHHLSKTVVDLAPGLVADPYDSEVFRARSPERYMPTTDIPVLACLSWQDDMVGSRSLYSLDVFNPRTTWAILTNGYHTVCDADNTSSYLMRFFDRFVKHATNGFEKTPHIVVFHDAHAPLASSVGLATENDLPSSVSWVTTYPSWPVAVAPTTLHLHDGGRLDRRAGRPGERSDRYVTPLPSSGNENGYFGEWNALWKVPDAPGGAATYTTPALSQDAEFFGPGSVNLWLTSTGTDTDLQVTLSEIRPDGREVYVQRGWLRASHRILDASRSTALRPYHTHLSSDAAPLVPGAPTQVRVELMPFDYVFRAGSSVRLTIDTPTATGLWAFLVNPMPAVNTVLHDNAHDSQLVLGLVRGARARAAAQPCNTLLNQPCRKNVSRVPRGRLKIG